MELLIDRETLKRKIEADPDLECEAGLAITSENFDQFVGFLKVLTRDDVKIQNQSSPEEEVARLRKYCSAAAHDYEALLERMIQAGEEHDIPVIKTFAKTAKQSRESSEFLRLAAEGRADHTLYEDELSKAHKTKSEIRDERDTLKEKLKATETAVLFLLWHADLGHDIRDAQEPLNELRKLFPKKGATDEAK